IPGVSIKTICASGRVTTPWMEVRVVCGLSATIATFCPTSAFSSVDLPAFGSPTSDTNPERNGLLMRDGLRLSDPYLRDAQLVAGQHLDSNAVAIHKFARLGYASEPLRHQAAHRGRFEILFPMKRFEQV